MATKTRAPKANPRTRCWSCGSPHLTTLLAGVSCDNCGATWTDIPQPGPATIEPGSGGMGPNDKRSSSPSQSVAHRAAAAREKKARKSA